MGGDVACDLALCPDAIDANEYREGLQPLLEVFAQALVLARCKYCRDVLLTDIGGMVSYLGHQVGRVASQIVDSDN